MESKNGISFIVRVRNEEKTLEKSIRSLFNLSISYEIIIVLHLCTDNSMNIANQLLSENVNIKIFKYDIGVSRAGYETLATDIDSKHSFVTYSNWCLSKATFPWKFKWDADLIATPELIDKLNTGNWKEDNKSYEISAKNSTSSNCEEYLSSGIMSYTKYIFWEVGYYRRNRELLSFDDTIYIEHASELSDLKQYWNSEPWYEKEDNNEARIVKNRIQKLVQDYGVESKGMARASNPECSKILNKIYNNRPSYVNFYR